MPLIGFEHNFIRGLSDFWQRFFADSDQLEAMYDGTAVLMGQAYLDLVSNVLNVSLVDAPAFNKEFYKFLTLREDQVFFVPGESSLLDRWCYLLPSNIVSFASLDNKVLEPTAHLQERIDYDLGNGMVQFRRDPTDPLGTAQPLPGYAKRQIDVVATGKLTDAFSVDFVGRGVYKGDVLRLVDIGIRGDPRPQRKIMDLPIVLVRQDAVYLGGSASPMPGAVNYVVLRQPASPLVQSEHLTFVSAVAQLNHTRIVQGSVKVYAKKMSGEDVVEGVDYTVDYELGRVLQLTTWGGTSALTVDYAWSQEVFPLTGDVSGTPPLYYNGTIAGSTTVRVTQLAFWAPDTYVDRFVLSNNFGSLIGRTGASSESYRAFLLGIFQLYVLGPVLARIESALNVICGLPVIRDEGEVLLEVDTSHPDVNIVRTTRSTGAVAEYAYPHGTPLRTDVQDTGNWGTLTFRAFEPLSLVVKVTDYVQDPSWWHNILIPAQLFSTAGGAEIPDDARRTVTPRHIEHRVGAEDDPKVGDPGLYVGADEYGVIPPPGHPILRRRFAFVMMDRFFKAHMFYVSFDRSLFAATNDVVRFSRIINDLNDLILSAKPAHTYIYVEPSTSFVDALLIYDSGYYQPQRYSGADSNAPEIYDDPSDFPSDSAPYSLLGLSLLPRVPLLNQCLFTDHPPVVGDAGLRVGDYFHYEDFTESVTFPDLVTPVVMPDAPTAPARAVLVGVEIEALIGGLRLVENIDYVVDYSNRTVQALTTWDGGLSGVSVKFVQARLLNPVDGSPSPSDGDMPLMVDGVDPTIVRAAYDSTALDLFNNPWPVTNHRDLSLVERPLTIKVIS